MFFCILHEIGHIIIGLSLKMKPEKIEIMPLGLAVSFYRKLKINNLNEICIALAGPIMSLALVILSSKIDFICISQQEAVYSNILILIFNLLPIYPLDGGRIIKGILDITLGNIRAEILIHKISKATIILLTVISSIGVYYYKNFAIFLVCIFLWYLILKEKNAKTIDILPGK